jgi:hypothetical protein
MYSETYLSAKIIGQTLKLANLACVKRPNQILDPFMLGTVQRLQNRVLQLPLSAVFSRSHGD